ncbi:hypothetical protein [Glutamicibacter arilaitensis]|uniref:hypothetical protein n=1 Tax=Glutamicibacter arilaitensis TaxID=256701 RepID=UPI0038505F5C
MKTTSIAMAIGVIAVALVGCTPADRATSTVEYTTGQKLQAKADMFGTSIELERGLYDCEQAHPIPVDHAPDHPESVPLADCVKLAFEAHQAGRP